jgi:pimeloyl-ACP methyl ester carboxylesterase
MTRAVTTVRGGKVTEDVVVPLDRLGEAIERTHAIADAVWASRVQLGPRRRRESALAFLVDTSEPDQLRRAEAGSVPLFDLAVELGGRFPASKRSDRCPVLLISGESDHTVPWAIVNSSYKRQRQNSGVTEVATIPNRGHALTIDSGWREVADKALEFIQRFA